MKRIAIILCIMCIAILSVLPPKSISHNESSRWMEQIEDSQKITELSIPGSHDAGATHSIADVAGKCQSLSIASQLNIGIRFFDIRLKLDNNELNIVHSFVDQKLSFEDVLEDVVSFIKENDSEFLILSIKEDDMAVNSSVSFSEELMSQLSAYKDVIAFDNQLPETVGEARGKIYLISRNSTVTVGVPAYNGWKDSQSFSLGDLYIQDNYCISDIQEKKDDIIATIDYSSTHGDKLVLNFISCYLENGFPPSYAGTTAKEINQWFIDYIKECEGDLGIVIGDFVTSSWAKVIYERNFND